MPLNNIQIKTIKGSITGSEDSSFAGSFSKEVSDFIKTVEGPKATQDVFGGTTGSMGNILSIDYIPNGNLFMTAIIAVTGSLP